MAAAARHLGLPRTTQVAEESARLVDRLATRESRATTKVIDALFISTSLMRESLQTLQSNGHEDGVDTEQHIHTLRALSQPAALQTVELRSFSISHGDTLGESFGNLQEINEEFVSESRELMDQIEMHLPLFASGALTPDILDEIARCLHTVKGVASILRHSALEALTHAAETISGLRKESIGLRASHGTTMFHVIDITRKMLRCIEQGKRDADVIHAPVVNLLTVLALDITEDRAQPQQLVDRPSREQPRTIEAQEERSDSKANTPRSERLQRVDPAHVIQIADLATQLERAHLEGDLSAIGPLVIALQQQVAAMQSEPASNVLAKLPRLVRATAKRFGKRARLEVHGGEVLLERRHAMALSDILTQVVGNAITHGIETPSDRLTVSKPAEGLVRVTVEELEGHVVFTIEDDGQGVDIAHLKKIAVQRGLLNEVAAAHLNSIQAAQLLFEPGLSTAQYLSGMAGRGIGMDITRTLVEQLNGRIELTTRRGDGTTFRITLPRPR